MQQNVDNCDEQQRYRRLEAMQVQFVSRRPKGRIKIVVQADGGRPESRQFRMGEDVRWNDIAVSSFSSSLVISIWRRPWYIYRRLVARFTLTADDCDLPTTERSDAKGRLKLALTLAEASPPDMDQPTDTLGTHAPPVDPVQDAVTRSEHLKAKILDARPKVKDKKVILEKLGKARGLTGYIDTIGDALGDAHPIAGAAFSVLGLFIKCCENQEHCRDAALDLLDEFDTFMKIEGSVPELDGRVESVQPVQDMLVLIDNIVGYINEHTKGGYSADLWSSEYLEKINAFKEGFSKAHASFQATLQTMIYKGLDAMHQEQQLRNLKPVADAHFRSSKAKPCLENTRIDLLEKLRLWSDTPPSSPSSPSSGGSSSPLYWLYGAAGTGKSTAAKTFAQQEELRGSAILCFFCSRDNVDLSTASRLLPTLAYSLALQHAGYARAVIKVLSNPKYISIASSDVSEQFKVLFNDILPSLSAPAGLFVGAVDAVDECGDTVQQGTIAWCLWKLATLVTWLRFFVTSRREPMISDALKSAGCIVANIEDESSTADDIRQYIVHELSSLSLTPEIIDALVKRSAGLFIWCSTVVKVVHRSADPKARINQVLSSPSAAAAHRGVYKELYKLYDDVLRLAIQVEDDEPLAKDILGLVLISSETRSLSCEAMSYFTGTPLPAVKTVVNWMHAVLYQDGQGVVRVYHNSFRDYLELTLDSANICQLHRDMADRSLTAMSKELRFNPLALEGRPCLNKDIPNLHRLVTKKLSPLLQYASLFWFHHLARSGPQALKVMEQQVIRVVCNVRALFYLEVLSLLDELELGARVLFECTQNFKNCPDIVRAAGDLEFFISLYNEAMKSAPHIYLSALTWAPTDSWISQELIPHFTHLPLISNNDDSWDSCIAVRSMGSKVNSVAYCPDGSRFVVGLADNTLRIADARTGAPIGEPLRCHTSVVHSVAWSPDGTRIASGSEDKTVRLWDAHSGEPLGEPFRDHSRLVNSVAFSPDSTRVVSGSRDDTLRIWDVRSGAPVGEPLRGHSDYVRCVAYSPDGTMIASASDDQTVRIWDAKSGRAIGQPLEGHSNWVRSVSYSPCGTRIVSASNDKTLRIWDAQSGEPIGDLLEGHSDGVLSAAFSPDGALLASCGQDNSVRLRDAKFHAPLAAFQGHSSPVNSVAFSPDSLRLISGSDDGTVRIWNTSSRTVISDSVQGHSGTVTSVAYSADSTKIVSGSEDATVRVWDARSGAPVGEPFRGHSDEVWAVAISPDNTRIVSGSHDNTLRIWELQSGRLIGGPLQGHTNDIECVAYSPDGARIASGSSDIIWIWNVESGERIGAPLQGHSGTVWSLAYSPNGRHIVSGSSDKTVRIWDAQSGAPIGDPLTGHSGDVNAVAYSPDGARIVSASYDRTLRIWDAVSRAPIGTPLEGQSYRVLSVAYAPDGKHIVSGGYDKTIRIWDAVSGEPVGEPLQAHFDLVCAVAYSPDGTRILSGSLDKMIHISECAPRDERWQRCLSSLDDQNGWVRDGEDILFWVPHKYRARLRYRTTVVIGEGVKRATPVVDVGKVWRYAGERWTEIYKGMSD